MILTYEPDLIIPKMNFLG